MSVLYYPLPQKFSIQGMPEEIMDSAWGKILGDTTVRKTQERLAALWPDTMSGEVAQLREMFLTYQPLGIALANGQSYLELARPELTGEPEFVGDSYYFSVPPVKEFDRLEEAGQAGAYGPGQFFSPLMAEFYLMFSGFRERMACSGHFIPPHEWKSLREDIGESMDLNAITPWDTATGIYHAGNGDRIVMNEAGQVAWHCLDRNSIIPLAEDFRGFLAYFIAHLENRRPLDSYGAGA